MKRDKIMKQVKNIRLWVPVLFGVLVLAGSLLPSGQHAAAYDRPKASATEQQIAVINKLYDDWLYAVENADIEKYLSVLDPTIELIPTDAPALRTNSDYGVFLQGVFKNDTFKIEKLGPKEIVIDGGLAYARYDYNITRTSLLTGETFPTSRNFLDILMKNDAGEWKIIKHIWNYTEPGTVP
jgi:ketosteroid isomerase-like protein